MVLHYAGALHAGPDLPELLPAVSLVFVGLWDFSHLCTGQTVVLLTSVLQHRDLGR
jgi:hypothetical protein